MNTTDIFESGETILFQGREWKIKSCFRNQALLERPYPKARARKTERRTYGITYTLQRYGRLVKVAN